MPQSVRPDHRIRTASLTTLLLYNSTRRPPPAVSAQHVTEPPPGAPGSVSRLASLGPGGAARSGALVTVRRSLLRGFRRRRFSLDELAGSIGESLVFKNVGKTAASILTAAALARGVSTRRALLVHIAEDGEVFVIRDGDAELSVIEIGTGPALQPEPRPPIGPVVAISTAPALASPASQQATFVEFVVE
jgi:hypothetical protein